MRPFTSGVTFGGRGLLSSPRDTIIGCQRVLERLRQCHRPAIGPGRSKSSISHPSHVDFPSRSRFSETGKPISMGTRVASSSNPRRPRAPRVH